MSASGQSIAIYQMANGRCPFIDWFDRLRDTKAKARILARLASVRAGQLGDIKSLRQGIFELRIDIGPGYRIYLAKEGLQILVLLVGGDKSTQSRDIIKARDYFDDYKQTKSSKSF